MIWRNSSPHHHAVLTGNLVHIFIIHFNSFSPAFHADSEIPIVQENCHDWFEKTLSSKAWILTHPKVNSYVKTEIYKVIIQQICSRNKECQVVLGVTRIYSNELCILPFNSGHSSDWSGNWRPNSGPIYGEPLV
jgi:hypothetical protein